MKHCHPWRRRCFFLLLILSLGAGLDFLLPDQPCWTLDVDEILGGFATDGSHFFTFVPSRDGAGKRCGPVRLRNSRTGAEDEWFFRDGAELQRPATSGDGRYLAAIVEPNEVRVIDFQEWRGWSLRAKDVNGEYQLHFSPRNDTLQVRAAHAKLPDRNFLFELPSAKLFANPDDILHAHFAPDGRYLACVKKDGLHLWDRQAQKEVRHDLGDYALIFSPDGRRLVAYDDRDEKEPVQLILWDLETHRRLGVLPVEQPLETPSAGVEFSCDSRWLVTWHDFSEGGRVLETWDSATGKRLALYVRGATRCSLVLAADSSCILLHEWSHNEEGDPSVVALTLLEMPSAKVRWQRKFPPKAARVQWLQHEGLQQQHNPDDFRFSPDGNTIIAFSPLHAEWEYLEIRTGATLKTVRLLYTGAAPYHLVNPVASPDGRWLLTTTRFPDPPSVWDSKWLDWARRWQATRRKHGSTLTVLFDSVTGEELLRLKIEGIADNYLAPDGKIVLTETSRAEGEKSNRRLQAWPVPAQRPWTQVAGIPMGCAAAVLALRWAWRRWRKSAPTTGEAPDHKKHG